ncbi:helix-turn-helix domain-containing protein [Kallotenue papyrolyticum]|uniref:helix-turn-helix domain-containing protein n=1 Tax=Kallotenue papyrolyticum TaxID=1325125 RepID=UPI0004785779|nr:helix-turn-helix transcriptional regulator [Kallotenue papyrolyticum]
MGTIRLRLREMIAQYAAHTDQRLTLEDVAHATGIDRTTLTMLADNQVGQIDLDHLARLCDYLHCAPADLLEYRRADAEAETLDAREIVSQWEAEYGADEHPRR